MALSDVIGDSKPLIAQGIIVAILAGGYSLIIIDSDINFFDDYVLDDIRKCYEKNVSAECQQRRIELDCKPNENQQLCLGNKYWKQVNKQAFGLAGLMFVFRLAPSIINHFSSKRFPLRGQAFAEAALWSFTVLTLFMGAVIDIGYYAMRGIHVPDNLNWLNGAGFFVYTANWTGLPNVVERSDLYLTFLASLAVILIVWLIAIYLYSKTGLKTLS